ncbi:hypothetical protein PFISCL1PPCAC_21743, partial [Pristionchus fissidentatus]
QTSSNALNNVSVLQNEGCWIIRVIFNGASSLSGKGKRSLKSKKFEIDGLMWSVEAVNEKTTAVSQVLIYLKAECKTNPEWSCAFSEKYRLISFKNSADFLEIAPKQMTTYNKGRNDLGCELISVEKLLHDSRKFVDEDSFL